MSRQQKLYAYKHHPGEVTGIFYMQAGRRIKRRLCSWDEARVVGVSEDGVPIYRTKADFTWSRRFQFERWQSVHREILGEVDNAPPERGPLVGRLMQDWLDSLEHTHAGATVRNYKNMRTRYLASIGDHQLGDFTRERVTRFLDVTARQGLAPSSQKRELNSLRAWARWALADPTLGEYLPRLPQWPKVRVVRTLPRTYTDAEIAALRDTIHTTFVGEGDSYKRHYYHLHLRAFMMFVGTGMRRGEVLWLRWDTIDLDEGLITVRKQAGNQIKERREKQIPILFPELQRFLEAERAAHPEHVWYLDDGRGNRAYRHGSSLSAAFVDHQRNAGLRSEAGRGGAAVPKAIHGFRAHFITSAVNMGVPLDTVSALVGHSQVSMTQAYVSNDMPRKVAAGELFRRSKSMADVLGSGTDLAPPVVN